jgi:hypothetical protein
MSDLDRLAHDLLQEVVVTTAQVKAVVTKGALNVKQDWQQRATGIEHAPRYPRSISYDVKGLTAQIGPEDSAENQGFLGHILEHGGAHNAPRNDGGQALDAEEPKFVKAIHALAGKRLT